jgi:hypothetical protein
MEAKNAATLENKLSIDQIIDKLSNRGDKLSNRESRNRTEDAGAGAGDE